LAKKIYNEKNVLGYWLWLKFIRPWTAVGNISFSCRFYIVYYL